MARPEAGQDDASPLAATWCVPPATPAVRCGPAAMRPRWRWARRVQRDAASATYCTVGTAANKELQRTHENAHVARLCAMPPPPLPCLEGRRRVPVGLRADPCSGAHLHLLRCNDTHVAHRCRTATHDVLQQLHQPTRGMLGAMAMVATPGLPQLVCPARAAVASARAGFGLVNIRTARPQQRRKASSPLAPSPHGSSKAAPPVAVAHHAQPSRGCSPHPQCAPSVHPAHPQDQPSKLGSCVLLWWHSISLPKPAAGRHARLCISTPAGLGPTPLAHGPLATGRAAPRFWERRSCGGHSP